MTYCSTQALLAEVSRGVCVSVSCGHASCSRPSDTRLPHTNLHHPSSLPASSIQSLACKMWCYCLSICVPAVLTRHRRKDPLLHLSAPHPGVERLLRQRVMGRPIMQTAVRHKASSRTPPSPLFPTSLDHPESGMQNVVLWHVHLCACVSHVTASQTHSSARGSRGFCVRASCGDPSCSRPGRQTHQRLPRTNLHHPSSLPCFSILSLACKM